MLTLQFMNSKHMQNGDNISMFNLTKNNLGPFNHSNIISGKLRVIIRLLINKFRTISRILGDGRSNIKSNKLSQMRLYLKKTVTCGISFRSSIFNSAA